MYMYIGAVHANKSKPEVHRVCVSVYEGRAMQMDMCVTCVLLRIVAESEGSETFTTQLAQMAQMEINNSKCPVGRERTKRVARWVSECV